MRQSNYKGGEGDTSLAKVVWDCLTEEVVVSTVMEHKKNTKAMVKPLTHHMTLTKSLKLVRSWFHHLQTAEVEEIYGASISTESGFCRFLSLC